MKKVSGNLESTTNSSVIQLVLPLTAMYDKANENLSIFLADFCENDFTAQIAMAEFSGIFYETIRIVVASILNELSAISIKNGTYLNELSVISIKNGTYPSDSISYQKMQLAREAKHNSIAGVVNMLQMIIASSAFNQPSESNYSEAAEEIYSDCETEVINELNNQLHYSSQYFPSAETFVGVQPLSAAEKTDFILTLRSHNPNVITYNASFAK